MLKIYRCKTTDHKLGYKTGRAGVCFIKKKDAIDDYNRIKEVEVLVDGVRPNVGIQDNYRKQLNKLIASMILSISYTTTLEQIGYMKRSYAKKDYFNIVSPFVRRVLSFADGKFMRNLEKVGKHVWFPGESKIYDLALSENVALIKSIPEQYLNQVESILTRGKLMGKSQESITQELMKRYKITRRRAKTIARDQNGKMTAAIVKYRQDQLGIKQAIWIHTDRAKEPRPTHIAVSGDKYDIHTGMYIDEEWLWPGTAINCRCISKSILTK